MLGAEAPHLLDLAERQRLYVGVALACERGAHGFQHLELSAGRGVRVVGDIVGGAGEAIEGEDGRAVLRRDEERGDGEVLIGVAFAGGELG